MAKKNTLPRIDPRQTKAQSLKGESAYSYSFFELITQFMTLHEPPIKAQGLAELLLNRAIEQEIDLLVDPSEILAWQMGDAAPDRNSFELLAGTLIGGKYLDDSHRTGFEHAYRRVMEPQSPFADALRAYLTKHDLAVESFGGTVSRFPDAIGITLENWLAGISVPSQEQLKKLTETLDQYRVVRSENIDEDLQKLQKAWKHTLHDWRQLHLEPSERVPFNPDERPRWQVEHEGKFPKDMDPKDMRFDEQLHYYCYQQRLSFPDLGEKILGIMPKFNPDMLSVMGNAFHRSDWNETQAVAQALGLEHEAKHAFCNASNFQNIFLLSLPDSYSRHWEHPSYDRYLVTAVKAGLRMHWPNLEPLAEILKDAGSGTNIESLRGYAYGRNTPDTSTVHAALWGMQLAIGEDFEDELERLAFAIKNGSLPRLSEYPLLFPAARRVMSLHSGAENSALHAELLEEMREDFAEWRAEDAAAFEAYQQRIAEKPPERAGTPSSPATPEAAVDIIPDTIEPVLASPVETPLVMMPDNERLVEQTAPEVDAQTPPVPNTEPVKVYAPEKKRSVRPLLTDLSNAPAVTLLPAMPGDLAQTVRELREAREAGASHQRWLEREQRRAELERADSKPWNQRR